MSGVTQPNDLNSAALLRARVHPSQSGLDGAGTVICVIDYGFDLLHPALRTASGETRFAALIDQNGARLERAEINRQLRACQRDGKRDALDSIYDPHDNYFGRDGVQVGAHGSWVASIAAGSRTAEFTGAAPKATLVGVQLSLPDSAWREEDPGGRPTWLDAAAHGEEALADWCGWRAYEDSDAIVNGLTESYAFARSLRPQGIVLNLSIGAWAGGHDGASKINRAVDAIVADGDRPDAPTVAVVAGTGNAGADEGHVSGPATATEPFRFTWVIEPQNVRGHRQQSKLEIWTDCPGNISVDIVSRTEDASAVNCTVGLDSRDTVPIRSNGGQLVGIAQNRGHVRNGLRAVRILLQPSLAFAHLSVTDNCAFDVAVRPAHGDQTGVVHAWLERDCAPAPPAKLRPAANCCRQSCDDYTLTSLACARSVISVAGLDNTAADDCALAMSGRGPRPWYPEGLLAAPLLAAPGHRLFGARSKTAGYMRGSGTSAAAAVVSGACALAFQAADIAGRKLNQATLASALLGQSMHPTDQGHADRTAQPHWRSDIGFGALRFDASAVLPLATHTPRYTASRKEKTSDERTLSPPV